LVRKTVINYASFAPTPIYPGGASIFDRPLSVVVKDGNSNRVAETATARKAGNQRVA
jgi:hypothetical protein